LSACCTSNSTNNDSEIDILFYVIPILFNSNTSSHVSDAYVIYFIGYVYACMYESIQDEQQ